METTGVKTQYPAISWDSNSSEFLHLQMKAMEIGASIHIISKLRVDNDFVSYGPLKPIDLAKNAVDESKVKSIETVILLNWPKGAGSEQKANNWAKLNHLGLTNKFVMSALGRYYPKLDSEFGLNDFMYVISTEEEIINPKEEKQVYCLFYNGKACCIYPSPKHIYGNDHNNYFAYLLML